MNIENLLKKTISSSQYRAINILSEQFDRLGIRAFLVGGTVRDILLGKAITDIDIVLEADPQDITSKFDVKYEVEVHSISQFGTCKINLLDQIIDLAMARKEEYSSPADLPVVEQASFEDDLARRDFSINAFAAGLNSSNWCELIDFHNGLTDLESKQIRVLHSKSFEDDPTRIFRGLRYSGRLGFDLEKGTQKMMIEGLRFLSLLSGVRLTNEIRKIFSEENSDVILSSLDQYEVMTYAHESFPNGADLTKRRDLLRSLEIDPLDRDFYAFVSLISSSERQITIERLNLGNEFIKFGSDIESIELLEETVSRGELHDQLKQISETAILVAGTYVSRKTKSNLDLFLRELNNIKLLIDGKDLLDLGVPEGPRVGDVLSKTLAYMIESGPLSKSEQLIIAKNFIKV